MSNLVTKDQGHAAASRAGDAREPWQGHLREVVSALRVSREVTHNIRYKGRVRQHPSQKALARILDQLSAVLFPTHFGRADLDDESIDFFVGGTLNEALGSLAEQVRRDLMISAADDHETPADLRGRASDIVRRLALQLPQVRSLVVGDLFAAYAGDPAAKSYTEILLGYPGLIAVLYYRLARALYTQGATLLARLIMQIAQSRTAIDIHPGAEIGHSFFIDHGTGVVIGETAVIGDRVRLYQHVTLGARSFRTDDEGMLVKGNTRHPIVEDDVVIYAGATVLGRVTIGRGSVIGGNVWLTQSVPPGSIITQARMEQVCPEVVKGAGEAVLAAQSAPAVR